MGAAIATDSSSFNTLSRGRWIRSKNWDLTFLSVSVVLVTVPYLIWLIMRDVLGIESDAGRQVVNLSIAVLIGGPHM